MEKLTQILEELLKKEESSKEFKKTLTWIYEEAERRRGLFEDILSCLSDCIFVCDLQYRLVYANHAMLEKVGLEWEEAKGKKLENLDFGKNLSMTEELQEKIPRVITTGEAYKGEVISKSRVVGYNYILEPLSTGNTTEAVAGSCRDISDRLKIEQELEEEVKDMHRLHEISTKLISSTDIDALLDDLLDACIEIMDADKGYLHIIEKDKKLHLKSHRNFSKDALKDFELITPDLNTICAQALKNRKRQMVTDIQVQEYSPSYKEVLLENEVLAAQSTPVISWNGQILGMISTHWKNVKTPNRHQLQMLDLLAREAADLIEHRRYEKELQKSEQRYRELSKNLEKRVVDRTKEIHRKKEQLKSLTAELVASEQRERQKFASILHDDLQQLLVSAKMYLSMVSSQYEDDNLEKTLEIIDRARNVTRNLTKSLSSEKLYERGFDSALQWLKRNMAEYHYLNVELDINVENVNEKLDVEVGILLFESIRELLLNVVKHARVDSAILRVCTEKESLKIFVEDKGAGFDPEDLTDNPENGFGIYNIKKRLKAVGGFLDLDSKPGDGTRVKVKVPL